MSRGSILRGNFGYLWMMKCILENAFLSALPILQVWWYLKICSDIVGINNKSSFLLDLILTNSFTSKLFYLVY